MDAGIEDFRQACRSLLWRVGRTRAAIEELVSEARALAAGGMLEQAAMAAVYDRARQRVIEDLAERRHVASRNPRTRSRWRELLEQSIARWSSVADAPDFQCDAALGGLARWLRAAGYDARFWPGIEDDRLLEKMPGSPSILLTTDTLLAARGVIAGGAIAGMLVSIRLKRHEQFLEVARRLELPLGAPCCMACGGALVPVDKHAVADRIPPKTFPWLDDYYQCSRCSKLFWRGTHWRRIEQGLRDLAADA